MIKQYIENEEHNQKVAAVIEKRTEKQAETMNLFFWAALAISGFTALVTIATWWMNYGHKY